MRSIKLLTIMFFIFHASSLMMADTGKESVAEKPRYVRIEAKGVLRSNKKAPWHCVETGDVGFPGDTTTVVLLRSEDKNHHLDEYLKSLEGQTVIVTGFLLCGRLENKSLTISFSNESQIKKVQ